MYPLQLRERITIRCRELSHLIGSVCLPYCPKTDEIVGLENQASHALGDDFELARQACRESELLQRPTLYSNRVEQSIFSIPLESGWFAIGRVPYAPGPATSQLIEIAGRAALRETELEERERTISIVETELYRCYQERTWLRELNSQRAVRKRNPTNNSRQAIESVRRLTESEVVGIFVFADRNSRNQGLESMVTASPTWTVEDIRFVIQKIDKPDLGDYYLGADLDIKVRRSTVHSAVVVPIGETNVLGYIVACNIKGNPKGNSREIGQFSPADASVLIDLADYLLADGYANLILEESEQLVLGTLRAMSTAIEARDPYTHGHSERVARVASEIARAMHLSDTACQEIYLAGILHDIGKIGIPDRVLLKAGALEPDEYEIIKKHPEIGYKIIDELGKLKFTLPGILYHHERFDGNGYPHRLKGEEIPLMARILSVSDAFDAMTSSRLYRDAMPTDRAVELLKEGIGTQWDEPVVRACLGWIEDRKLVLPNGEEDSKSKSYASPGRLLSQALRAIQM